VDVENFRRNRVEDVEEILKGLVEKGIWLRNYDEESIKEKIGEELKSEI
jgi:hypothetical protein